MDIQLILSDVDGTLINDEGHVSDKTRAIVQKVVAKGYRFGIATGRHLESARGIAKECGLNPDEVPIIALNGLLVEHRSENYYVKEDYLDYDTCLSLSEIAKNYYMGILFFYDDDVYYMMDDRSIEDYKVGLRPNMLRFYQEKVNMHRIHSMDELKPFFEKDAFLRKVVMIQNDEYTELVKERIAKEICDDIHFMMVGPGWAEIMPSHVNKGDALLRYVKHQALDPKKVMTFGDSDNDLTMLLKAGHGVTMENARNSVKIVADAITDDHAEDGVANYLEKHLLRE